MPITSPQNERLKDLRRLQRRRERERTGRFAAEGEDLLAAADAAGWPPVLRLCAAGSGLAGHEVDAEVLSRISALGSGSRALAVYEQRWAPAPLGPVCVYLHGLSDPGNVGAVLRAALAFGAASVALGPGSADPFGPKAVRASMGAVFAIPLVRAQPDDLPGERIALVPRAGRPLEGPAPGAVSLLIGAEREGLPPEVVERCNRVAHIPIQSESLNGAMAATVALYELTRGRVAGDSGPAPETA